MPVTTAGRRPRLLRRGSVVAAVALALALVAPSPDRSTDRLETTPPPPREVGADAPGPNRSGRDAVVDTHSGPRVDADDQAGGVLGSSGLAPSAATPGTGRPPTTGERPTSGAGSASGTARPSPAGVAAPSPIAPASALPPPTGPVPVPPTTPPPPVVVEPEVLDLDQVRCPNLGLVAIGDATGAPTAVAAASARFRALAATTTSGADLVCALPLRAWRDDLVVQQLRAGGKAVGLLIGGYRATDPVLRISEVEWTSYQFRSGGPSDHNFLGVPVARQRLGGVEVIRTTNGGLVMERPDSWGNVVVGGAWGAWMARGGPTGEMGLPRGKPTGRYGLGAFQDFDHGHLLLPGVTTDLEAESRPSSDYEWHPLSVEDGALVGPTPGNIVMTTGTSYYVDRDGVRHWLATGGDWSCAYWNLGARETEVRGWVAARHPLGAPFVCPD